MEKFKKYNKYLVPFFLVILIIIFYKMIDNIREVKSYFSELLGILKPFFIGFLIAYIFNLPCKKIQGLLDKSKYKVFNKNSKLISIFGVYILAIFAVIISVRAIVPAIYRNVVEMYTNLPTYLDTIVDYIEVWQDKLNIEIFEAGGTTFENAVTKFVSSFDLAEFSKYAQGVITLTSGVINTFIAIIVSLYMLIDKEAIKAKLNKISYAILGKEKTNSVGKFLKATNDVFSKYIYCILVDAMIVAVLSTIILSILRVKYAIVIGLFIGFANFIPYFGSIISFFVAIIITLLSGGIFKAIWVAISLIILQQIDGNYIGPKIMGEVLEIRPLVVIFAVTVGGGLFGILGLLFSVPIAVVIKMVCHDYIEERIANKEKEE